MSWIAFEARNVESVGKHASGLARTDVRSDGTDSTVRWAGIGLAALIVTESVLGILAAGVPVSFESGLLLAHLALGAGVVGGAVWAVRISLRLPSRPARLAAGVTMIAVASTASVGAVFLIGGNRSGGVIDRGLALLALAGSIAMVVWGSVEVSSSSIPPRD